jgi:signal transduction histidine kinase
MILLPAVLIISVSSVLQYARQRREALDSMSLLASHTGEVIERALQQDMLVSDFDHIQTTFDSIGEDGRIGTLLLMDPQGKVIFAPKKEAVGTLLLNSDATCQPCHALPPEQRPSGIVTTSSDGGQFFRSMHPIENQAACTRCHDPDQKILGVLLTDLSITPVERALSAELRRNLLWSLGTTLLILLLVNVAIRRWVVRRIDVIGNAIEGFGRNAQRSALPEYPPDEIGRLSAAFNAMTRRIDRREHENQILAEALEKRAAERGQLLKKLISAQEEERMRVARELHDELGQALSSTAIQIALAKRKLPGEPGQSSTHLDQAESILTTSTEQMYDLISGLRPSILDDLGLQAALRALLKRMLDPQEVDHHLEISCAQEHLEPEIETVLYRVFQEALTNVVKHAHASTIHLKLNCENGSIEGELLDDGVGFDDDFPLESGEQRGLGLLGMRERVEPFGGSVEISSQPGEGTRVLVHIPLRGGRDG